MGVSQIFFGGEEIMGKVNVRYIVDDVASSVDFYTKHLGFEVLTNFPAFADVVVCL